ncbi:DUF4395 family protein [candidate division KSB1 bacterium]|nr:DUF4395 family protein [candidate division KSB1 bacterium]
MQRWDSLPERDRQATQTPGTRSFACGIGALWLIGTALTFESGALITGYILGVALTLIAALVSTTDICIPSMIYGAIFGRPQPVVNKTTSTAP